MTMPNPADFDENPNNTPMTRAAAIEAYREQHPEVPAVLVTYFFDVKPTGEVHVTGHKVHPAHADAIRGNEVDFAGAVPGLDRAALINDIVNASTVYAVDARRRMGLHAAHRIAITVPADEARRALFEEAEATLWNLGVVFDWSLYDTWRVGKELADGFEPDDMLTMTKDGWRVHVDKEDPRGYAERGAVLATVARLLAAQDACDDRNRRMTVAAEEPPPVIV